MGLTWLEIVDDNESSDLYGKFSMYDPFHRVVFLGAPAPKTPGARGERPGKSVQCDCSLLCVVSRNTVELLRKLLFHLLLRVQRSW